MNNLLLSKLAGGLAVLPRHDADMPPHQTALQVMCGNVGIPTATVVMKGPDGIARRAAAIGTGPVDAAYKVWCQAHITASSAVFCCPIG